MTKTVFDKIKELLSIDGWKEQDCGTVYLNGEYKTNFYDKEESEIIHIGFDTFPDEEIIERLKGDPEDIITKKCTKCGKFLFKGTKQDAKGLIIYCDDC